MDMSDCRSNMCSSVQGYGDLPSCKPISKCGCSKRLPGGEPVRFEILSNADNSKAAFRYPPEMTRCGRSGPADLTPPQIHPVLARDLASERAPGRMLFAELGQEVCAETAAPVTTP